jgi:glucose/arabinose dehydrogenase
VRSSPSILAVELAHGNTQYAEALSELDRAPTRNALAATVAAAILVAVVGLVLVLSRQSDGTQLGSSPAFDDTFAAGCSPFENAFVLDTSLIPLTTTTVIDLVGATAIATLEDSALVATRAGVIHAWTAELGLRPLIDLSDDTSVGSDRGLLNLVTSPDGTHLLVLRTNRVGNLVLTAHQLSNPELATELLVVEQPDPRHNGGGLVFAPDGQLLIGIGDGGGQGDPNGEASNPESVLGSILRVSVDIEAGRVQPVRAPVDGYHDLVWATGVRNPHRLWFDQLGAFYVADVGELCREEITKLAGDEFGLDLGWSAHEGSAVFDAARLGDRKVIEPIIEWSHLDGSCAAIGGTSYVGDISELRGTQIVADLCTGRLFAIGDTGTLSQIPVRLDSPVDVSIGPDGELWVTDIAVGVRRISRTANGT